ncbi:MAG: TetR/AcrR family transcriptional regulator [Patescibacteria group bacterium]|nr:TetR/AcrR family transcriptional regulator [Patescibacteria group bacterium]
MARMMEQRTALIRDAIYGAAVAILTRDGLDAMTMERVAEEAGVAKGSLYNYFQNKTDLLKFVHERTVEPLRQSVQELLGSETPAIEKLRLFVALCIRYLGERRGLFHFLFTEHAIHKFIRHPKSEGSLHVATIVRQGVSEGVFRPVDAAFHGTLLFGAIRQMLEERIADDQPWAVDDMTETVMSLFLGGLRQPISSP